jgi:hypothetical protein
MSSLLGTPLGKSLNLCMGSNPFKMLMVVWLCDQGPCVNGRGFLEPWTLLVLHSGGLVLLLCVASLLGA